jgi:hypothetical protein
MFKPLSLTKLDLIADYESTARAVDRAALDESIEEALEHFRKQRSQEGVTVYHEVKPVVGRLATWTVTLTFDPAVAHGVASTLAGAVDHAVERRLVEELKSRERRAKSPAT